MPDLADDLNNLVMDPAAQPLLDAVKKHIAENVEPIVEEFHALNAEKADRWSWHPRQLELLEGAKKKAKESVSSSSIEYKENLNLTLKNSAKFMMARLDQDKNALKTLGDQLIDKGEQDIVTLVGVEEKSVRTFVWVKKELSKKVNASDLLRKILTPIEGKGGGKPVFCSRWRIKN